MSLAVRALVAIALMIGFYALAIGVASALLWIPYAEWVYLDRIHIKLAFGCVVAAGLILWSILPRRDRFSPPGPRISQSDHPKLFTEINDIAKAVGQTVPSEVYLVPEVNAWVAQRGGVMGFGSRRVMALGVPLMGLITVSQFRAVVAHEFGHYHGGDTKLGPWIYKTRSAIWRTLAQLEAAESILAFLFNWYGKMFLRVTLAISRAQEYAADRIAAQVAGAKSMIEGLKQLHRGAVAWDAYMNNEVVPVLNAGFSPPLASGLVQFLRSPDIEKPVAASLQHELENGKADPMDSHPSLPERIAALQELPDKQRDDSRPATELLENFSSVDASLFSVDESSPDLRKVNWNDIVEEVWVPRWQSQVERQSRALEGLRIFDLQRALQDDTIQQGFRDPDGFLPTSEQRAQMAISVAGCAFALALFRTGWKIHALPGELYCERNGEKLEPFTLIARVADGEVKAEEWTAICARLGIADESVIVVKQAHA